MLVDAIDHNSGIPPYRQLTAILRRQIERGELARRLPSERALAQAHGVSVGTVRKALALLREAGLVETYRSYGSRAVPPEERNG